MKTLIAIFFGVCFNALGFQQEAMDAKAISDQTLVVEDLDCVLSVTGFANFEDFGRISVTMTASAPTCSEAAEELRAAVIKREFRISR